MLIKRHTHSILILFCLVTILLFFTDKAKAQRKNYPPINIEQHNEKGNNNVSINQYKVIKIIREDPDRFMLFSGIRLAEKARDESLPDSIRTKCKKIFQLCSESINEPNTYDENKIEISDLWNSVTSFLFSKLKLDYVAKERKEYEAFKTQFFNTQLDTLRISEDPVSLVNSLDYFNGILSKENDDSISLLLLTKHTARFANAVSKAIESSNDETVIDKIFDLHSESGSKLDAQLEISYNNALKKQFIQVKEYSGDLLIEGYKSFLKHHKKFGKPSVNRNKSIYSYIINVSNQQTITTNKMLAQSCLFEKGILFCNEREINKGWNWSSKKKYFDNIPALSFNSTLNDLITFSYFHDTLLNYSSMYFKIRERTIKGFHYKLKKFQKIILDRKLSDTYNLEKTTLITDADILRKEPIYEPCSYLATFSVDYRWQ